MQFIGRVSGCNIELFDLSINTNAGLQGWPRLTDGAHRPVLYIIKKYKTVNCHMQASGEGQTG